MSVWYVWSKEWPIALKCWVKPAWWKLEQIELGFEPQWDRAAIVGEET